MEAPRTVNNLPVLHAVPTGTDRLVSYRTHVVVCKRVTQYLCRYPVRSFNAFTGEFWDGAYPTTEARAIEIMNEQAREPSY